MNMKYIMKYKCAHCGVETELKFIDDKDGSDHPICTNCLVDLIQKSLEDYATRQNIPTKFNPLSLNEGVSVYLEMVDLKIQQVEPPDYLDVRLHKAPAALIARSTINNQYFVKLYTPWSMKFDEIYPKLKEKLAEWFPNNCYHEDLVPRTITVEGSDERDN